MSAPVMLENGTLRATVLPALGGTIAALRHLASGAEVLGRTPWDTVEVPEPSGAAADETAWLSRFGGGWPVMFPNAGDACTVDGARHGFHGEASVTPFALRRDGDALVLTRRFLAAPATMTRRIALNGDRIEVAETVAADAPCTVAWGQHVTLGSDLLAGPVALSASARRVQACTAYNPPANPLTPGGQGDWPRLPGRAGTMDLSRPPEGAAMLACLADLGPEPWAELTRADGALAVRMEWWADPWPLAWLWVETGGTREAPWFGRGRMIGIEPCSTWPATGLAAACAAGGPVIRLAAGEVRRARISLRVFVPRTPE